jgi:thiaminase/transcriptional activator TenA
MGFYEDKLYSKTIRTVELEVETPYLKQIIEGTLPIEKFKFQVKQNYSYLLEYTKALAVGFAKCQTYEQMAMWLSLMRVNFENEVDFYRVYWKEKLNISLEELDSTTMARVKRSYTSFELARSWEGDLAEHLTALLPCPIVYWQLGKHLKTKCKLPEGNIYREWIEFYTVGRFDETYKLRIELINDLTKNKTPKELARLEEIYAVSCNYEYLSWRDMYYKMETWPIEDIFPKKFTTFEN